MVTIAGKHIRTGAGRKQMMPPVEVPTEVDTPEIFSSVEVTDQACESEVASFMKSGVQAWLVSSKMNRVIVRVLVEVPLDEVRRLTQSRHGSHASVPSPVST